MKSFTHPNPIDFAYATGAILATDHGVPNRVEEGTNSATLTSPVGVWRFVQGPLQGEYRF